MFLKYKNIPEWLKKSKLYISFIENEEIDDGGFEISNRNFKSNIEINNIGDFINLLITCDYWDVKIPKTVYSYINQNNELCMNAIYDNTNYALIKELLIDINDYNNRFEIQLIDVEEEEPYTNIQIYTGLFLISEINFENTYIYNLEELYNSILNKSKCMCILYISPYTSLSNSYSDRRTLFISYEDKVLTVGYYNNVSRLESHITDLYSEWNNGNFLNNAELKTQIIITKFNKERILKSIDDYIIKYKKNFD